MLNKWNQLVLLFWKDLEGTLILPIMNGIMQDLVLLNSEISRDDLFSKISVDFIQNRHKLFEMIENQEMITCAFLGQQEVGKTSFINKFFRNAEIPTYTPTIAVEISFSSYQCQEGTVRVKCWDTSGQSKYKAMVCYHLKNVDIVVIMFDLTNLSSFEKVTQWVSRLKEENVNPSILYLVGNKLDLAGHDAGLRKIAKKKAEEKAKQINAQYAEISVTSDDNFDFFAEAFQQVLSNRALKIIESKKIKANSDLDLEAFKLIQNHQVNPPCQCKIF